MLAFPKVSLRLLPMPTGAHTRFPALMPVPMWLPGALGQLPVLAEKQPSQTKHCIFTQAHQLMRPSTQLRGLWSGGKGGCVCEGLSSEPWVSLH